MSDITLSLWRREGPSEAKGAGSGRVVLAARQIYVGPRNTVRFAAT